MRDGMIAALGFRLQHVPALLYVFLILEAGRWSDGTLRFDRGREAMWAGVLRDVSDVNTEADRKAANKSVARALLELKNAGLVTLTRPAVFGETAEYVIAVPTPSESLHRLAESDI